MSAEDVQAVIVAINAKGTRVMDERARISATARDHHVYLGHRVLVADVPVDSLVIDVSGTRATTERGCHSVTAEEIHGYVALSADVAATQERDTRGLSVAETPVTGTTQHHGATVGERHTPIAPDVCVRAAQLVTAAQDANEDRVMVGIVRTTATVAVPLW